MCHQKKADQNIDNPEGEDIESSKVLPAERGVILCNKLFFLKQQYKNLTATERKEKRLETEVPIWEKFRNWLDTINPTGGSKLEKAVNYAMNHKMELMNYLLDGRCESSNNAAERKVKSYVMARKNFLFHGTVVGANASAIVFNLVETAKANNLNVFQYLYTLLLYMPDYKDEPAGIDMLLPWSDFTQENCSGITDTEKITPETRGNLPL
ncbi:MAG: transposase [Clostridiales bacterium]|nr:transposase [Clostridiales bacterium]